MNTYVTLNNVEKGRKETDMNDANRYIFECLVPAEQAPKLDVTQIPWANIRIGFNSEFKSAVVKEIETSLYLQDGTFHSKHKGVRIVADSATLDNGKLTINFGNHSIVGNHNSNLHGLGDGGTTVRVISEAIKRPEGAFEQGDSKQYVRLYVYCGDYTRLEMAGLVESWNTGLNASQKDMMAYQKKFSSIESLLKRTPTGVTLPASGCRKFPDVSYYSGDPGDYDITELVQMVCLFAMEEPRAAYAGTGGCLSFFDGDDTKGKFQKALPLLFDIMFLYESIVFELPDLYNATGKKGTGLGRFGGTRPIEKGQSKAATKLPFTGNEVSFTPHKAWALPMLAAFRGALDWDSGEPRWIVNPLMLFREIGAELYKLILKAADKDTKFNLTALGRDPMLYEALIQATGNAAGKASRKGKYTVAGR